LVSFPIKLDLLLCYLNAIVWALQYESPISINNSLRHEKHVKRRVQNGF
jgi:hypothetical protein